MPATFRTAPRKASSEPAAVVIHCIDPRYQPHFQDFLHRSLKLDRYALIAVPGGAHFLKVLDHMPNFSWVGWHWMKFVHDVARAERVILIGHDNCLWYLDPRFSHDTARIREHITGDIRSVRANLIERFPHLHVETYFARLEGDTANVEPL